MGLTKKQKEILEKACKRSSPKIIRLQLKNAFGSGSGEGPLDTWGTMGDALGDGTFSESSELSEPSVAAGSGTSEHPAEGFQLDAVPGYPDLGHGNPAVPVDDVYEHIEQRRRDIEDHLEDIEYKLQDNIEFITDSTKKINSRLKDMEKKVDSMTYRRPESP